MASHRGKRGTRTTNGSQICNELESDKEGDTNSQRLRDSRPAIESARVVKRNDTRHRAPISPWLRAREDG